MRSSCARLFVIIGLLVTTPAFGSSAIVEDLGVTDRAGLLSVYLGTVSFPRESSRLDHCIQAMPLDAARNALHYDPRARYVVLTIPSTTPRKEPLLLRRLDAAYRYLIDEKGLHRSQVIIARDPKLLTESPSAWLPVVAVSVVLRGAHPGETLVVPDRDRNPIGYPSTAPN